MNKSNQAKVNHAQPKTTERKAWRPLKLRVLEISTNTRSGSACVVTENGFYKSGS